MEDPFDPNTTCTWLFVVSVEHPLQFRAAGYCSTEQAGNAAVNAIDGNFWHPLFGEQPARTRNGSGLILGTLPGSAVTKSTGIHEYDLQYLVEVIDDDIQLYTSLDMH